MIRLLIFGYGFRVRVCISVGFVPAASQDWGLGFGPVTVGRERAKRAPELWIPPPNLKPQSWRASNGARRGVIAWWEGRSERRGKGTEGGREYMGTFIDLGLGFSFRVRVRVRVMVRVGLGLGCVAAQDL